MNEPLISVVDVTRTYEKGRVRTEALRGLSAEVSPGSWVFVLGPSGCGKSTLLHLMGGLDRPTTGRVMLAGEDLGRLPARSLARARAEKVGFVFQFFNLLSNLTVEENVLASAMFGSLRRNQRQATAELLDAVGLSEKAKAKPSELSGGEQQRVAIARALVNDPAALLLDEPTGNLDSESSAQVLALLQSVHDRGKTIVMVTHDRSLTRYGDTALELRDGRLCEGVQSSSSMYDWSLTSPRPLGVN